MVRVVRLERTVSWSQTRRDTNFAIPGYSFFCHDTMARGKNKDFSVCGHSCGQNRFCAVFGNRGKSRKRRRCKALRCFASSYPGYNHGTPKAGALPTAQHPVMKLGDPAGRIHPKQARCQLRSPPEIILFFARLPCSPGLRSTITPTVYWIFRRKSTAGARFCRPQKAKGETSCEASPFGKCFAVLPAGITWHPLPPCGR